MFRSKIPTTIISAVGGSLMLAVVSCSSGAPTASSQGPGDHDAFAQCMTENGVPAPPDGGPGGPGGHGGPPPGADGMPPPPSADRPPLGAGGPPAPPGVDRQTWDNALQACASLAPQPPPRA